MSQDEARFPLVPTVCATLGVKGQRPVVGTWDNKDLAAGKLPRPSKAEKITVSPHILRHTLLRKVANEKGVHYAMKLSGHRSDRYIWRYVQPNEQSLADALDELE